jgi:hypothetical protein
MRSTRRCISAAARREKVSSMIRRGSARIRGEALPGARGCWSCPSLHVRQREEAELPGFVARALDRPPLFSVQTRQIGSSLTPVTSSEAAECE